ncbi:MAG: hypothetical protein ACRES0_12935, partial [Pseudomonas sp.]
MWTAAPQIKTVQQPVEFLNRPHEASSEQSGDVLKRARIPGALAKGKAVAFPIQNPHSFSRLVEEHEKHRVKCRDLDAQFDQRGEAVDGFSEADGLGVEIFFDFCVRTHHEVLVPERSRKQSIGDQIAAFNVGSWSGYENPTTSNRIQLM